MRPLNPTQRAFMARVKALFAVWLGGAASLVLANVAKPVAGTRGASGGVPVALRVVGIGLSALGGPWTSVRVMVHGVRHRVEPRQHPVVSRVRTIMWVSISIQAAALLLGGLALLWVATHVGPVR